MKIIIIVGLTLIVILIVIVILIPILVLIVNVIVLKLILVCLFRLPGLVYLLKYLPAVPFHKAMGFTAIKFLLLVVALGKLNNIIFSLKIVFRSLLLIQSAHIYVLYYGTL